MTDADRIAQLENQLAAAVAELATARNTCEMLRVSNNNKHDRLTRLEAAVRDLGWELDNDDGPYTCTAEEGRRLLHALGGEVE